MQSAVGVRRQYGGGVKARVMRSWRKGVTIKEVKCVYALSSKGYVQVKSLYTFSSIWHFAIRAMCTLSSGWFVQRMTVSKSGSFFKIGLAMICDDCDVTSHLHYS